MASRKEDQDLAEIMRDEMIARERILSLIREKPMTVPELADALGASCRETMLWTMALWKYGHVSEAGLPDDKGYYRYQITE
jgi:hypothetical protein